MRLGEKLQRLRKKSGLSQEQLAAQLTVSRQAVSKWELDETMPDTDNIIQLARIFGVSCDYLLREEVEEPGTVQPIAPGETHLDEQGWVHNARVLSIAACAIGLLLALGGRFVDLPMLMVLGLAVQVAGVVLFELAVPRMGARGPLARLDFLIAACWLIVPTLFMLAFWHGFWYGGLMWLTLPELLIYTLPLGAACTVFLLFRRRRIAPKK